MIKTRFNGIENNTNISDFIEVANALHNPPDPLDSLPRCEGRYVISSRKSPDSAIKSLDHAPPHTDLLRDEHGRIIIPSRKERQMQSEDKSEISEAFWPFNDEAIIDISPPSFEEKPRKSKKQKGKSKKGKKGKKNKKKKDKKQKSCGSDSLSTSYLEKVKSQELEEKKPVISSVLGALAASKDKIAVENGNLFVYDKQFGYFKKLDKHQANLKISELLNSEQRLQVPHRTITDAVKSLVIVPEVQKTLSNSFNTPLINCKNGVLNIETGELLKHSSKYEFKEFINANYDADAKGPVFKAFIADACKNDKDLIHLVQEVMGYSFSSYIFLKKAFLFWGPRNSGKSLILKIISNIVGEENVSNATIQQLSEPCFLAKLMNAKLNVNSEVPNEPITDINFFKSCVSGGMDAMLSKLLYHDPEKQPCTCKLLFGSNHFIPLKTLCAHDIDAYFDRLLILPFTNEKSHDEIDLMLSAKLSEEYDYIFTWAMKGLKRLIDNNWRFTECDVSEDTLYTYRTSYSPESVFFNEYLIEDPNSMVSSAEVEEAYREFTDELNISVKKHAMKSYISSNYPHIKSVRKRYKGSSNALHVYEGLKLLD